MPFNGPLADRLAIHELNASYGDLVSAREVPPWVGLWAEDAEWHHPKFGFQKGHAAIEKTFRGALDNLPFVQFSSYLGSVEVDGDLARGRVWVTEVTARSNGEHFRVCGSYVDDYVRQGEIWRFQVRRYAYGKRTREEDVPEM